MFIDTSSVNWCEGEKPKDTQLYTEYEFNCAKNKNSLRLEDNILKISLWIISVWETEVWLVIWWSPVTEFELGPGNQFCLI